MKLLFNLLALKRSVFSRPAMWSLAFLGLLGATSSLHAQTQLMGAELQSKLAYQYGKIEFDMYCNYVNGVTSTYFWWRDGGQECNYQWNELDIETIPPLNKYQSNPIWQRYDGDIGAGGCNWKSEAWHGTKETIFDTWVHYTLEWTPNYIAWYHNGILDRQINLGQYGANDPVFYINKAMRYCFNIWSQGPTSSWIGNLDYGFINARPAYMFVDNFKLYTWNGNGFNGAPAVNVAFNSEADITQYWNKSTWGMSQSNGYVQWNGAASGVTTLSDGNSVMWMGLGLWNGMRAPYAAEKPGPLGTTGGGGGTTVNLPGTVQAEAYATMQGIQTEATTDAGGGQNIGYVDNGDFMTYTVNVATAGTYKVDFRLAGWAAGGVVTLQNASGTKLAAANAPNNGAGAYQAWNTVAGDQNFTLPAGTQTLRIYATAGPWNLNWFTISAVAAPALNTITVTPATGTITTAQTRQFTAAGTDQFGNAFAFTPTWSTTGGATITAGGLFSASTAGTYTVTASSGTKTGTATVTVTAVASPAISIPATVQAEAYTTMLGIQTEPTTDAGGGQNVGYVGVGDYMTYTVNVATAGTYKVSFRLAGWAAGGVVTLQNATGGKLAAANAPNNGAGAYQVWSTVAGDQNFTLPAGTQTIRIYATAGPWNLNWFSITAVAPVVTANTVTFTPPMTVQPGNTYSISVPYTSLGTNEIQVSFFANGWNWITGVTQTVQAGSGTATFNVTIPAGTALGGGYIWQTEIRPVGSTWQNRFDVEDYANVQVVGSGARFAANEAEESNLVVYPVPTDDIIFIENATPGSDLMIYNTIGQLVKVVEGRSATSYKVSVATFEPGIYFILNRNGDQISSVKFQKR